MSKVQLSESASSVAKTGGNRWKVVLAVPGKGHSGTYSRQLLETYGPQAFPAGTKAFIKHANPEDRDPRDQFGKYPKTAWYDDTLPKDKYPDGALVSELEVRKSFVETFEDMGEDAELSMFVRGEQDDAGNVITLEPYRGNSVDLVAFGALEGSGVLTKLYESLNSNDETPDRTSEQENERKGKMEKEIQEAIDAAVKSAITALAEAPKVKTEAEIQAEVDAKVEAEVGAKVDAALEGAIAQIAEIDAAELLPSMAESLKADVKKGKFLPESLAAEKAKMAEFKTLSESLNSSAGVWVSESGAKTEDWTVR